jgi:hypothetical protein
MGLVSRVTPVHTALRNCTGDEGRPFGFGDQVADPKPPQAAVVKSRGGERCGKAGTRFRQVRLGEASASEPLRKCRKPSTPPPPQSTGTAAMSPSGSRSKLTPVNHGLRPCCQSSTSGRAIGVWRRWRRVSGRQRPTALGRCDSSKCRTVAVPIIF